MTAILTVLGWLDLLGTAVLAGGVSYAALVLPLSRAGRRAVYGGALLVAVTLLCELGATGFRLNALAVSGGASLLYNLLRTHWGVLWIARCVGLAVIVVSPVGPRARLVLVALWLLARSLQGHAGAHGTVPAIIDWIHLSAACAWMGGLLHFLLSPAPSSVNIAERMRRVATLSVAALVAAGVYGAFLHVPTLTDLVSTAYGRVLLAKVAIATGVFALAALNHFLHVPALRRGRATAFGHLQTAVQLEIAGGALVLLLSALLGALPMPTPTVH
jgi:putative copper export protein